MTPATLWILMALACRSDQIPGQRDCVAIIDEVSSPAECHARYAEIRAGLPANWGLGFPECYRPRRSESKTPAPTAAGNWPMWHA